MTNLLNKNVEVKTYKRGVVFEGIVIEQYGEVIKIERENGDVLKFFADLDEVSLKTETQASKFEALVEEMGYEIDDSYGDGDLTTYIFEGMHYDVWVHVTEGCESIELETINHEYMRRENGKEWHERDSRNYHTNRVERKTLRGVKNYLVNYLN